MFRLILFVIFITAIAVTMLAAFAVVKSVLTLAGPGGEENMPRAVRHIAFAVLMLLLLGLTTGWLGGV